MTDFLWLFISALHLASGSQHCDCVTILLENGAKIKVDSNGISPADLALNAEIKKLFMSQEKT